MRSPIAPAAFGPLSPVSRSGMSALLRKLPYRRRIAGALCTTRWRQRPVFDHIQISAAGHKIGFDADAVGILEQDGVIARRPGSLFRRMDNLCAKLLHRDVQRIDIFARA